MFNYLFNYSAEQTMLMAVGDAVITLIMIVLGILTGFTFFFGVAVGTGIWCVIYTVMALTKR